ncbi:MAG: hypothetical protein QW038_01200 [Nanopusillaceae archaeon]
MAGNFIHSIKSFIKGGEYKEKLSDLDLIIASYIIANNFVECTEISFAISNSVFADPSYAHAHGYYTVGDIFNDVFNKLRKKGIIKCVDVRTLEKYLTEEEKQKIYSSICKREFYKTRHRDSCRDVEEFFNYFYDAIICYPTMDKKTFEKKYLSKYGLSVDEILENFEYFLKKGEIRSAAEGIKKAKELKEFLNEIQK